MTDIHDTLEMRSLELTDSTMPIVHMPDIGRYNARNYAFHLFSYVSSMPPKETLVSANLALLKGDVWDGATAPISLIDIANKDGPEGCRHQVGTMFFRDISFHFELATGNVCNLESPRAELREGYIPALMLFYHNGALQKTAMGDTNLQMTALTRSTLGLVPGVVLTGVRGEGYRDTHSALDLEPAFSVLQPTFARYSAQLDEHINRIAAGFSFSKNR